jgi:ribosomal subunit interface protein
METSDRQLEVVVRGRNVEVPDHFRQHVTDKLRRVERYDNKVVRADVELQHEKNRRQNSRCQQIEITCRTRGPVVRAEACAADFYQALELVMDKLERRFRQAADRRRVHHGRRNPTSVAVATAGSVAVLEHIHATHDHAAHDHFAEDLAAPNDDDEAGDLDDATADEGPGRVVREKDHPAKPMSVDQALFEMELVGHDFYLFAEAETGRPCVVYRRHAYDYGLIRLAG